MPCSKGICDIVFDAALNRSVVSVKGNGDVEGPVIGRVALAVFRAAAGNV